jgi:DNA-binding IclR family transcriptional regulator
VVGSLTVSMPAYRYTAEHAASYAKMVTAAASELSAVLSTPQSA